MSDLQEIERDLREYLDKAENLNKQDKLAYLIAIFAKRLEFKKLHHIVNFTDFFRIVGDAKTNFIRMRMPIHISRKRIEGQDNSHVALLEAFVGYLNNKEVLKKLVKFDYTEE